MSCHADSNLEMGPDETEDSPGCPEVQYDITDEILSRAWDGCPEAIEAVWSSSFKRATLFAAESFKSYFDAHPEVAPEDMASVAVSNLASENLRSYKDYVKKYNRSSSAALFWKCVKTEVRNRTIDHIRKHGKITLSSPDENSLGNEIWDSTPPPTPEYMHNRWDVVPLVMKLAVEILSEEERVILFMKIQRYSSTEIAATVLQELGKEMTTGDVDIWYHRAKAKLLLRMKRDYNES